jgi:hypothetical protein
MSESHPAPAISRMLFLLVALLATAIDIGAFHVLAHVELGPATRILVALSPLPGDLALIWLALRAIRKLDEFQKRVHFEAVVVAFLSTGVAVFVYGYLQKAAAVGPLNFGIVWAFMLVSYAVGYRIAVSHYQ